MNRQFEKRQAQVLEILAMLSKAAAKKGLLVFLGGSAIQTAVLKQPRRLSVDLDIYCAEDAEKFLSVLEPEYKIEKRPARQNELFSFYSITKGTTQVKIDVTRFPLSESGTPYQPKKLKAGKAFETNVAAPDYLLASKLSALAIGTIGRRAGSPIDFLKDVFDSNCLIEEFGIPEKTWAYFEKICRIQNKIRKTAFAVSEVADSAVDELLASASVDDSKATVKKADLGNFNEYLLQGALRKSDYWLMACRLAAYLSAFRHAGPRNANKVISAIEKSAGRYADRGFIAQCEQELLQKKLDAKQLHELKILASKALTYLHAVHYPPA